MAKWDGAVFKDKVWQGEKTNNPKGFDNPALKGDEILSKNIIDVIRGIIISKHRNVERRRRCRGYRPVPNLREEASPQKIRLVHSYHEPGRARDPTLFLTVGNLWQNFVFAFNFSQI